MLFDCLLQDVNSIIGVAKQIETEIKGVRCLFALIRAVTAYLKNWWARIPSET